MTRNVPAYHAVRRQRSRSSDCENVERRVSRALKRLCAEPVTRAAQRVDQFDVEAIVDFAPQPANEDLEHVCERIVVLVPDVRSDRSAIDDLLAMANEELEQRKLFRRQLDLSTAATNAMRSKIDLEIGDCRDFGQRSWSTSRKRIQTRDELAEGERLREIVVGAGIEPAYAIIDGVAGGQHQNGGADTALSEVSAKIEAVAPGEHDIENDDVEGAIRRARFSAGERGLANNVHLVLGEPAFNDCGEIGVVFDEQDAHSEKYERAGKAGTTDASSRAQRGIAFATGS